MTSIHTYKIEGIDGKEIDFSQFEGKKILVVNVASECGFTPQYSQLQELYEYAADNLVIVGMPSNDFGGQEPGDNSQIQEFCKIRYGVTFPLTTKVTILGNDQHPIYQWLTQKSKNGVQDSEVQWNFYKYLLDESGKLLHVFPSTTEPFNEKLLAAIGIRL